MKNWKRYLALLTALLLAVVFVACAPAEEDPTDPPAEQTQTPTEAPTAAPTEETEPVEETTAAKADYSAYMGNWYSGSVTLVIKEEEKWSMLQADEVFLAGHLIVGEETVSLYDMEGMEVAVLSLEEDGTVYAELYAEEMYSRINDFTFTRTQSDYTDVIVDDSGDGGLVDGGTGSAEAPVE